MKSEWNLMRSNDCRDNFTANSISNFFPRKCCEKHNKYDQRTPGLFKEEFRCTEMVALCSKTYCWLDEISKTVKLSSKGINQTALLKNSPMQKYRSVLVEQTEIETTNRGFRVQNNEKVVTYELKKKAFIFLPETGSASRWNSYITSSYLNFHISLIAFGVNFILKIFSIDSVYNQ